MNQWNIVLIKFNMTVVLLKQDIVLWTRFTWVFYSVSILEWFTRLWDYLSWPLVALGAFLEISEVFHCLKWFNFMGYFCIVSI